nr:hypothetical protein [Nitrospinaceae bacterium]NIR56786.1 hypothetical protein [Nitrospinaceae bacterium]NIS87242.1 hypothetical protein [Nitrospinaceae bacterium]NIT84107.1 hypothetical protein [Nitrospinaceae bacterium]NIU46293.1 hypothetical protein [Nitrospinaceae bacterium]
MKQTFSRPQTQSPRFEDQVEAVCRRVGRAPAPARAEGLRGASRGLFLAQLRKRLARPIVVLTADPNTAETLLGDLKYFFRHLKLKINPQFFPPWELLPYEKLSPLPEVSGERLMILNQLREGGCPFLVVPLEGALQCVVPRSVLENLVYPVGKGDSLDREILETCLSDNGYTRSPLVEDRGEYSVRGDIIDFYPPGFANPVRIQLFGDEVESIRPFDLNSQVSL